LSKANLPFSPQKSASNSQADWQAAAEGDVAAVLAPFLLNFFSSSPRLDALK
jgi:hypothetical protein